jgi:hypothetical protein
MTCSDKGESRSSGFFSALAEMVTNVSKHFFRI